MSQKHQTYVAVKQLRMTLSSSQQILGVRPLHRSGGKSTLNEIRLQDGMKWITLLSSINHPNVETFSWFLFGTR